LKLAKATAAPVCRKQPSESENTCVALDSKNAELRAEIGKLEARVNSLLAQQNSPAPAASGAATAAKPEQTGAGQPAPAEPKTPKPKPPGQPKPAVKPPAGHAAPEKAAEGKAGMPWGWIAVAGTAIFAAVGALQFWRHRRKRIKSAKVHAALPRDEESQVEPTLG
jgi:pilus assembly protein FimV